MRSLRIVAATIAAALAMTGCGIKKETFWGPPRPQNVFDNAAAQDFVASASLPGTSVSDAGLVDLRNGGYEFPLYTHYQQDNKPNYELFLLECGDWRGESCYREAKPTLEKPFVIVDSSKLEDSGMFTFMGKFALFFPNVSSGHPDNIIQCKLIEAAPVSPTTVASATPSASPASNNSTGLPANITSLFGEVGEFAHSMKYHPVGTHTKVLASGNTWKCTLFV